MRVSYSMVEVREINNLSVEVLKVLPRSDSIQRALKKAEGCSDSVLVTEMERQGWKFQNGEFVLEVTEEQFLKVTGVLQKYVRPIGRIVTVLLGVYELLQETIESLGGDLKTLGKEFKKS